jgi:hypothetical protein
MFISIFKGRVHEVKVRSWACYVGVCLVDAMCSGGYDLLGRNGGQQLEHAYLNAYQIRKLSE